MRVVRFSSSSNHQYNLCYPLRDGIWPQLGYLNQKQDFSSSPEIWLCVYTYMNIHSDADEYLVMQVWISCKASFSATLYLKQKRMKEKRVFLGLWEQGKWTVWVCVEETFLWLWFKELPVSISNCLWASSAWPLPFHPIFGTAACERGYRVNKWGLLNLDASLFMWRLSWAGHWPLSKASSACALPILPQSPGKAEEEEVILQWGLELIKDMAFTERDT